MKLKILITLLFVVSFTFLLGNNTPIIEETKSSTAIELKISAEQYADDLKMHSGIVIPKNISLLDCLTMDKILYNSYTFSKIFKPPRTNLFIS